MILTKILEENAKKYSQASALTMRMGFRTVSLTYGQVFEMAKKVAMLLEKEGVKSDDKVLLLAPNMPYWGCVFWGCMLRGAVAVPLNTQSTPAMTEKIAQQTGAKLFFASRLYKHEVPGGLKRFDIDILPEILEAYDASEFVPVPLQENGLVEILYTSGTTGDPKGVMLTHANLYSNLQAISQIFNLEHGKERLLSILPLSHIFEQVIGFLVPCFYGAQVVYAHSPAYIAELMNEFHITKMIAVPEFLKLVMTKIESAADGGVRKKIFIGLQKLSFAVGNQAFSRFLFHSVHKKFGEKLDTVVSAGAPLDPELEKKWNALGVVLLQGYGLTETSPLVTANIYSARRLSSVGRVAPGVQVRVADDGEILVKGPNVFQGYFKNEQKTREAFTDEGWFKTGDIGQLDSDGFLFLKGRKKYMILGPGGQNVFPEDLEEILNAMPEVKESCVLGVPTTTGMIHIHAVVLPNRRPLERPLDEIIKEANSKLASYQHITGWTLWKEDDFPRSATKKIKKEDVLRVLTKTAVRGIVGDRHDSPLIMLLGEVSGFNVSLIHVTSTLLGDLQLDSLMRIELLARIEELFGATVDESEITSQTTVADMEKLIREKKPQRITRRCKMWPTAPLVCRLRLIGQKIVFAIARIWMRVQVRGLENLENLELPAVFMPNHVSYIDPLVVAMALPKTIEKKLAFAAAQDVLYGDFWFLALPIEFLFNSFPLPRNEGEQIKFGLECMGKQLDRGFSVVIFPEGKMSENGKLLPLKQGAGLIATEMAASIIPVKIEGADYVLPYAKIFPRHRGVITVKFGKPIRGNKTDSYIQATAKIESALREL